ncbi:2'-5' RNA ligase family protein [Janibacter alkaliphilus]|uniref:2'-5' RNA ligase n=1 Tax=Janibacter alkaliphilus TaxID=1069963 RepID=A0A852WZS5_9MICO|nr:2'-5' RNA ligase family protein [Janibacter alkaliphilus]NYG35708.1 2'-5' RNA ligase [Janibacter alkaliphilus]
MTVHGVAVAIPEPWGEMLQAARERVGDPMARAIPPHVTLLPPTDIPDPALPVFRTHLEHVVARHAPFTMQLRGTGTFRPVSPVVFVQVAQGIPSCEMLEQAVRAGPVHRELEFPYHPHVTVAHALPEPALDEAFAGLATFDAVFEVTQIHLYDHGPDEVWRPQHSFTLTGSA